MSERNKIAEKYEHQGWPAVKRPDVKPPQGWSLELVTAVNRVRHHQLSPDGETIAFVWDREDLSDVYTMPTAGGGWPQRHSFGRGRVAYWSDDQPQWSPDGQWLAFTMKEHVHVVPAAGGLPQAISKMTTGAFSPVWMPDSQQLLISVEHQDSVQLLLTERQGGWPRPLVSNPAGDCWDARPSADGRLVAYTFRPFDDLKRLDICVVEIETGQIRELVRTPQIRNWSARWSPNGRQLAYLSEQSGWNEVWLVNVDGSGRQQLSRIHHDVAELAWSPDGTRLAVVVNREGAFDLAVLDAASGELTDLSRGEGFFSRPQWGPDGNWLTVEYENHSLPPDFYRVEMSGRLTQLTFSNLPALAANRFAVPERVSYKSYDGLEIPAFLYRPQKPNGAAIVHPHGGPSSQYVFEWDFLAQYFVAKGYTWICPNYRGSTGYGFEFEHANYNDWGGGDTQDCLFAARYLSTLPGIDSGRIGIYGGSYGGYMTACSLSRDPDYLFACGVDKYGDANILSSWAQCNRDLRLYSEIFLGHPAQNRENYFKGSPIYQVENIKKPVLILHGLLDDVVPPEASEEWVQALR
ncbi:MAG: S9 family peptidase, partial [Anaerolineales bacterium]|nr:S9 family peptidase [Anaerolineales bacterium]